MRFYIIFAVTFVAALLQVGDCSYGRINKYLVQQVNNDDVRANMEAAAKWLKDEETKTISVFSPVSDLKQFTALRSLIEEPKCDRTEYDILSANEKATDLYDVVKGEKVTRRVDKVLSQIFRKHGEECHQVHLDSYHAKYKRLDSVAAERVKTIADAVLEKKRFIIPSRIFYSPKHLYNEYLAPSFSIKDLLEKDALKPALDAMEADVQADPDFKYLNKIEDESNGKSVVNRDKVKELVRKYLIEPCKHFVNEMGPDLFIPASLDALFYNPVEETPAKEEDNGDYYLGWVSFNVCRAIVENEGVVSLDVIQTIRNE